MTGNLIPKPYNHPTTQATKANASQWIKTNNADVVDTNSNMPDYFRSGSNRVSRQKIKPGINTKMHNEFSDVFSGIGFFEGIFSLQVKGGSHPYQAPP